MSSSLLAAVNDYADYLWVTIPPIAIISAYFVRRWYLARRLRLYGIGKGAAGFQTNVRRVRVTPDIAARIRRGEDVSPAEIEAASRAADEREAAEAAGGIKASSSAQSVLLPRGVLEERDDRHLIGKTEESGSLVNEWLPDSITKPSKRRKGRR